MSTERAIVELAAVAGEWGAAWNPDGGGGYLVLPVVHGLRRGTIEGPVEIAPTDEGCEIAFRIESQRLTINRAALAVLTVGAISGILLTAWPFFPALLQLAPLAFVLAFVAWVLVVSRLRMSGAEEFLEALLARTRSGPD